VIYEAADSMAFDVPNKRIILYSKGHIIYKDMDLKADSIAMDQNTNMLVATYRKDSSGKIIGLPEMLQGETKMSADIIKFNFKNQRGLTQNTNTSQGEMFLNLKTTKKINENEYYGLTGRMTTCNLDTPHFAFITKKMKLVNKKLAVTGPVHPEFEGVPVPIWLPFWNIPSFFRSSFGFLTTHLFR
jgi:lipopolysaccharide assembly outer membrane protein LptD (OstA)